MKPGGSLLDENLSPKLRAGFDPAVRVVHARDLGDNPTDLELWTSATERALVIVTKDANFTARILALDAPPPWLMRLHYGLPAPRKKTFVQ